MENSIVLCSTFFNNSTFSNSEFLEKCEICNQLGHGYHFGAFTCRACAAFFRRCHFSPVFDHRKCLLLNGNCGPSKKGKWFCKKCRLARCLELGMTTTNIQYDRDTFHSKKKGLPMTVESISGIHYLISFVQQQGNDNYNLPYVDTSHLVQKGISIVLTPNMVRKRRKLSNLEQLTQELEKYQSDQKEQLSEKVFLSQSDTKQDIEKSICAVAKWLSCSNLINTYDEEMKIILLRSIWLIWGRLERIATTAKMRQFVVSLDSFVNYDTVTSDISCWSRYKYEEMKFFYIPNEVFYEDVISEMVEVQPDDVELTFILCILCFQITGKHFGGDIQEKIEELQDVLSNDLHEYYQKNDNSKYLLRLTREVLNL